MAATPLTYLLHHDPKFPDELNSMDMDCNVCGCMVQDRVYEVFGKRVFLPSPLCANCLYQTQCNRCGNETVTPDFGKPLKMFNTPKEDLILKCSDPNCPWVRQMKVLNGGHWKWLMNGPLR